MGVMQLVNDGGKIILIDDPTPIVVWRRHVSPPDAHPRPPPQGSASRAYPCRRKNSQSSARHVGPGRADGLARRAGPDRRPRRPLRRRATSSRLSSPSTMVNALTRHWAGRGEGGRGGSWRRPASLTRSTSIRQHFGGADPQVRMGPVHLIQRGPHAGQEMDAAVVARQVVLLDGGQLGAVL